MLFTLEVLQAKKGDSLLLHVGAADDPRLVVIDGGPSGVYRQSLEPRLKAIRKARKPNGELPIDLLMISHIDDDHIRGILDLTNKLVEQVEDEEPRPWRIKNLWHNAFDDIIGNHGDELFTMASAEVGAASVDGTFDSDAISEHGGLVLASVAQGRNLRNNAKKLGIPINRPGGGLVVAHDATHVTPPGIDHLDLLILGPTEQRVRELQEDWDKKLPKILEKEKANAEAAAYLDKSVYNLASIVALATVGGKTMLLTGDARGDDTLRAAREAGLIAAGDSVHVDLLKLPHHGSDRNVDLDFFQTFTADHYVMSGDGKHGNPELATFRMLFEARRGTDRPFTIYLTYPPAAYKPDRGKDYPVAELEQLFDAERQAGTRFTVATPPAGEVSLKIDLLDPYQGA